MKQQRIFIFEAEEGMVLSEDAVLPDGHMVVPANTILTMELIEKISSYHILEIKIFERSEEAPAALQSDEPPLTYYERLRENPEYKEFSQNYWNNISTIKNRLNDIVISNAPISPDNLLEGTMNLISSHNNLHLFDILHSMRESDDLTFVHCVNVSLISSIIGQWMNYSKEDVKILALCGLLHDLGKVMISDEILNKPTKLTADEYEIMKTHVNLGYDKLKDQDLDDRIKEACLLHHERSDGSGYPFRLKQDKIPPFARIVAIADVYDAMTSSRVYRDPICPFDVIQSMERDAFSKFDPKFLLPFLNNVIASYLHTNVKLSDGSYGEVVLINTTDLSRPIIYCNGQFIDLSKDRSVTIVSIM